MKRIAIFLVLILLVSSYAYAQLSPQGYIGLYADEGRYSFCIDGTGMFTFYCFVLPPETGMKCIELRTVLSSSNIAVFSPVYNADAAQPVMGGVPGDLAMCFNSCHNTDWVMAFSATLFVMAPTEGAITLEPFTSSPYLKILNCEGAEVEALLYANLLISDSGCWPPPPPPYLSNVTVEDESHIIAEFTQCLYESRAEDPDKYVLFPKYSPADTIPIASAEMDPYCYEVLLTLEGSLIQGVMYTLIAEDMLRGDCMSAATSQIDFQCTPVAVMLQGFEVKGGAEGVELSWELAGVDGDISFNVSRRAAMGGAFEELGDVEIERDGDTYSCVDTYVEPGESYVYRVDYELGGETGVLFETEAVQTPAMPLTLNQNVPNPFNPATEISYYLPVAADVLLEVYDVTGKRVSTLVMDREDKGLHVVTWQGVDDVGRGAASGIYFYRLRAGKEVISKKMVLLR